MGSRFRDQTNAMFELFERMRVDGVTARWKLRKAREMQHDPLSKWEAQGYVVEKRYATVHQSELFNVMGIVNQRNEDGEDVIMLLAQDQKHVILMVRHGD